MNEQPPIPEDPDRVQNDEYVERILKSALGDQAESSEDRPKGIVVVSTPHHDPAHDVIVERLRERDDIVLLDPDAVKDLPPARKQVGVIGHVDRAKTALTAVLAMGLVQGLAQAAPVELPELNTYGPVEEYPRLTDPRPAKKANKAKRPRWRR